MSRQIKFRAWDAEQNKMIETFDGEYQIHVNEEDGTVYCGGHLANGDWNEPPLMQFTGLYDKSGNEIFEGDIVQHDAWNYPFEIIFNKEKSRFVPQDKVDMFKRFQSTCDRLGKSYSSVLIDQVETFLKKNYI